jgi:hypothetical protein
VTESASLTVAASAAEEPRYTARGGTTTERCALLDEELEKDLRAVAVPVHYRAGSAVAAARHSRQQRTEELLPICAPRQPAQQQTST